MFHRLVKQTDLIPAETDDPTLLTKLIRALVNLIGGWLTEMTQDPI